MASKKRLTDLILNEQNKTNTQIEERVKLLEVFIKDAIKKTIKDIKKGNITNKLATLGSLNEIVLEDDEVSKTINKITNIYGDKLEFIADTFARLGKKISPDGFYTGVDLEQLKVLIDYNVESLFQSIDNIIGDVRVVIASQIIQGNDIIEEINLAGINDLTTELQTSLDGFHRTVTIKKAEDLGVEKFEYVGVFDARTRPFCRQLLTDRNPPIYTKAEIEKLDNEQGLPVFAYGGGYNCRHLWVPIVKD